MGDVEKESQQPESRSAIMVSYASDCHCFVFLAWFSFFLLRRIEHCFHTTYHGHGRNRLLLRINS